MDGHSGDVYFVAFHPTDPNVFATVSDSGHVHVWDSAIRQMTHCAVSVTGCQQGVVMDGCIPQVVPRVAAQGHLRDDPPLKPER